MSCAHRSKSLWKHCTDFLGLELSLMLDSGGVGGESHVCTQEKVSFGIAAENGHPDPGGRGKLDPGCRNPHAGDAGVNAWESKSSAAVLDARYLFQVLARG